MTSPEDPPLPGGPPPPPYLPDRGEPAAPADSSAAVGDPGPPAPPPLAAVGTRPPPPPEDQYPVRFDVAYPGRLSRLSTFFRLFLLIPVGLLSYVLQYVVFPVWIGARVAVICKRKYPRWLFDAGTAYIAWAARLNAYVFLQTDRYPSFDPETSPVTLEYDYPEPGAPSRWRGIIWRILLLIPHFIVLGFLWIALVVVVFIAWFAILFTGRYPTGMFDFVTGVSRWQYRVAGYFLGFTDRFPPFALAPVAGSASPATAVASGIIGLLAAGGATAGIIFAIADSLKKDLEFVNYAALQRGEVDSIYVIGDRFDDDSSIIVSLRLVTDPGDGLVQVLTPGTDERVVIFEWSLVTLGRDAHVDETPARFKVRIDGEEKSYGAELVTVGGRGAPVTIEDGSQATLRVVFVVPGDAEPVDLHFDPPFFPRSGVVYSFRSLTPR